MTCSRIFTFLSRLVLPQHSFWNSWDAPIRMYRGQRTFHPTIQWEHFSASHEVLKWAPRWN
jgi:hypothetical protein